MLTEKVRTNWLIILIIMHLYFLHLSLFKPSGELTLEEFIEGAKDHPDIMDMLKKLMDLTPVLVIIVEGRQKAINAS